MAEIHFIIGHLQGDREPFGRRVNQGGDIVAIISPGQGLREPPLFPAINTTKEIILQRCKGEGTYVD